MQNYDKIRFEMSEEREQFIKAFAVERPNGSIFMQLFSQKDDAYKFIEEKYDDLWANVQRKHKFKVVKVEVVKKK